MRSVGSTYAMFECPLRSAAPAPGRSRQLSRYDDKSMKADSSRATDAGSTIERSSIIVVVGFARRSYRVLARQSVRAGDLENGFATQRLTCAMPDLDFDNELRAAVFARIRRLREQYGERI